MVDFSLIRWTTCKYCTTNERFVAGTVYNKTSSAKIITIVIGDKNGLNVGQSPDTSVPGKGYYNFDITTTLPVDYTGKVYCAGWYNDVSQFNQNKSQHFDSADSCAAPGKPTAISAACQSNGTCVISWTKPSDSDIFHYIVVRFKNNTEDKSFIIDNTSFTDDSITNCSTIYSYKVYAIDKCLRESIASTRVTATAYVAPPTTGSIYCSSFPQGATIWLNGENGYGVTNKVVSNLTPGNYNLKFTLADYEDYTKTVLVEAGYESFVSKDLVPISTEGRAEITTLSFYNNSNEKVTEASSGDIVHAYYEVKNIGSGSDNFNIVEHLNDITVRNMEKIIALNETKYFSSDTWVMGNETSHFTVSARHQGDSGWQTDHFISKYLHIKIEQEGIGAVTKIDATPTTLLVGDTCKVNGEIQNHGGTDSMKIELVIGYKENDVVYLLQSNSKTETLNYLQKLSHEYDFVITQNILDKQNEGKQIFAFTIAYHYETNWVLDHWSVDYLTIIGKVECIQNIKILVGKDNTPVKGVKLTIDDVIKTTDIDGIATFNLIKGLKYTVYKSYLNYSGNNTFIACKFDPQILYITIEEPTIGKIEEQDISYDFVGEDEIEISVPVTNLLDEKYGFSLVLYNSNVITYDKYGVPSNRIDIESGLTDCSTGIPTKLDANETRIFVFDSSAIISGLTWNRYSVMRKNLLVVLYKGCYYTKDDILDQVLLYVEEETVLNTGEIISISHGIDGDEVDFMITIKNTSDIVRTYHVELFDESSKSIDIEPDLLPPTLNSGETKNIKLSSKWKGWTVMDVEGQKLTFKLWSWAYPGNIFDKILSHTKQYPMEEVEIEKVECYIDNPFDKTKCLLTEKQAAFLKWAAIGVGGLYVLSIGAPMIRGIGSAFEKSQK